MPTPSLRARALALLGAVGFHCAASAAEPERHPLAAPSHGPQATLFSENLAAVALGGNPANSFAPPVKLHNGYNDPRMWADRYHEFEVGAIGTGVAIGDYDGDGRPDIFVVNKTESCRLFRNLGDWKFEDVTEAAGVADAGDDARVWKQGVAFADVNNDGRLDLYVCRFGAPNRLYVNQGDGTFKEEAAVRGLAVVDASVMGCFCDYDRDGWLDVYVVTNMLDAANHPAGQKSYLFRNRGDGTFADVTVAAGISGEGQAHSATWWDYDGDGRPDLYVANDFAQPDKLYRNRGDGTFENVLDRVVPHTPFSSMGADVGDVNNDGLPDLLVADMAARTREKDQRGMAAMRGQSREPADDSAAAPQLLRNALYLNTGTGRCVEAACLAGLDASDWTWAVRFEDLDNDGRLDLVVTNGMHREAHNADLIERMMRATQPTEKIRLEETSPVLEESNLVFRNLGDLRFEEVGAAWGFSEKGASFGCAFGDLDGDGDLDVVYSNFKKGLTLLRNDSVTGHRLIVDLRGTRSNRFGVGARVTLQAGGVTQVRDLTLARGVLSSSEPALHFGLGDAAKIDRLRIAWPSGVVQEFHDLAADARLTIREPAAGEITAPRATPRFTEATEVLGLGFQSTEAPINETSTEPLLPARQNRRGPAVAIGELQGDRTTVLFGGTTRKSRATLDRDGGAFVAGERGLAQLAAPVNDGPILVFEANGDGARDVLVTKGGVAQPAGSPEYQPVLCLNRGDGTFAPAPEGTLPAFPESVGAVAAAEVFHSGRLDLFLGARTVPGMYATTPHSALWRNTGGRFEDVTDTVAPALRELGRVTSALWSDVDDDGWPDLVVALEWGGVKCFRNDRGTGFTDWSVAKGFAAAGTGWWTALAAADCNGDGRPDFAAGNLGLNTPYRAPALLFSGDFKGNGTDQLVEALSDDGKLYPRRSRKELGAAIPFVLRKYPRNDVFAQATLTDIFGDAKLAAATRLAATCFESGVFLSQPDGTYRFQPFPRLAQIAPIQGLVAADLDGDGCADIGFVGNDFAPVAAVGRFDGGLGLLLRGDGAGGFSAVPAADSGWVVPGDAKGLALADLNDDGWPDFVATRNHDHTLAFTNRPIAGRTLFRVVLRGPAGNPDGIGARITAVHRSGTRAVSEVHADTGHFGQSAVGAWIGAAGQDPVVRLFVRWPDGASSDSAAVPPQRGVVALVHP